MPRPILFAGGKLTSPGQTLYGWLVRNIHQLAANDGIIKERLGKPAYNALLQFVAQVVRGQQPIERFATGSYWLDSLWDIYATYGPGDIEEQPTTPAPAVPEPTEPPTQAAQESIQIGEMSSFVESLNELAAVANTQETPPMNEPMIEHIDFYPETLVEHQQLSPLGLQIVKLIDNLGQVGRLPSTTDTQMYITYCRVPIGGKPMMTPAAFFREFPGTTTRVVEAVLNARVD